MKASSLNYEEYIPTKKDNYASYNELRRINEEVIGWIKVPGTRINYPMVQSQDNKKYLNTNAMNQFQSSGAIFLDCDCSNDFSDFNTIIYGHHMASGMMFGDIDKYKDKPFFNEHSKGTLLIGKEQCTLNLYAFIKEIDGYDDTLYRTKVEKNIDKKAYLDYIIEKAEYTMGDFPDVHNHIILLSTCSGSGTNGRMLLVGYINEEKNKNISKENFAIEEKETNYWLLFLFIAFIIACIVYRERRKH